MCLFHSRYTHRHRDRERGRENSAFYCKGRCDVMNYIYGKVREI